MVCYLYTSSQSRRKEVILKNPFTVILMVAFLSPQIAISKEENKTQEKNQDLNIQNIISIEISSIQHSIKELTNKLELFNEDRHQNLAKEKEISKFLDIISTHIKSFYDKLDHKRIEIEKTLPEANKKNANIKAAVTG